MKSELKGRFLLEADRRPFWSDRGLALMAFVIPFVILTAAYAALQTFPFGGRHILTVDLFHQYAPFYNLLREKILDGSSFFYTGAIGLGTNFYALFAYYLASPLNLLLLLFSPAYLTEAVFLISLIKVGLMGFAFYHYLRVSFRRRGALAVAFSSFYALSGFVLAYSWNVMWLDTLILLPVVLLAMIRLIRDGKWILYPVSVALLLLTNYYTGFFAAVFTALYFPILLLRYTRDRMPAKRALAAGKTILLSLAGAALSAFLLYPAYRALAITSAAGDQFPKAVEMGGRPLAYLGQLFPFLQPTVRSGLPNLYAGLPLLILIPVYFLSSRIRIREKSLNGLLLIFLIVSFDNNVLNFLWHGMHYPNQLPYRYSFAAIFLLLTIAYDGLRSVREFRATEIGLLGFSLVFVIPVVAALEPDLKLSPWTQWGAMTLMLAYTLLFSNFKNRRYKNRTQVNILLAFMIFEILLSTFSGIYYMDQNEYYGSRDGYSAGSLISSVRDAASQLKESLGEGTGYRMEITPHKTSNDPALYGLTGISIFSSTSPKAPVRFMRDLGFQTNGINSYQYRGATLFSEALFGIRYIISREKPAFVEKERRVVLGNDLITAYENPYVFPAAFLADPGLLNYKGAGNQVFENQNALAKALFGRTDLLFHTVRQDRAEGLTGSSTVYSFSGSAAGTRRMTLTYAIEDSGPFYLYLDMRSHDLEKIEVRTSERTFKLDGGKKRIHELGDLLVGTELQLEVELSEGASESGSFEARLARLDTGVLKSLSREAQAAALSGFSMRDGRIEGRTASEEERVLFLSVPSDPGWTAYIDGEEAEIQLLDQALMALRIPAGEHQILMTFYPPGLNDGLLISGIALLILGLFAGLGLLLNRRKPEAVHEDEIEVEEEEEGDPGLTAGLMEEENVLTG